MKGQKLNLGCGMKRLSDYINVDIIGNPDLKYNLEELPWPWQDNSIEEIRMDHVLEHLGKDVEIYFDIIKEIYRVCISGGKLRIIVPHFRHQYFFDDPTHVRAITPVGLLLFSKKMNLQWLKEGKSNSLLALQLGVNLEMKSIIPKPSRHWFRLHPENPVDMELLKQESDIYNSLIEELDMELEIIK